MRVALLDFALSVADWPDDRFGEAERTRSAAVSCLLIATGAGGMPVSDRSKQRCARRSPPMRGSSNAT
jgi:hypothetical protein